MEGPVTLKTDVDVIAMKRRASVTTVAEEAGLLKGERGAIGARVHWSLIEAAKARSGLTSTTAVVEYALAKVALEDDYGVKLVSLKGTVPRDLDLEF